MSALSQTPAIDSQPVALVTGSGRDRIGNEVAEGLARDGYAIAVHYHSSEQQAKRTVQQLRDSGTIAESFQADVSQEDDVDQMFSALAERFGRLDVLATTSSIWNEIPLEEVTAEQVRKSFDVNTLGTFLCARRGGLMMAEQPEGGAIITFGDWAIQRPYAGHAAYFMAKGAIPALTRMMAVELAQRNPRVRVNCIHPGPVMFPPGTTDDEAERLVNATLVKHADCPQTVYHAVKFFVENPFVTGVCLPLDGGRTIYAHGEHDW